mmetsp:Transcript_9979/g.35439  ORF Transcript_9979/g.35439 Transcript_9979/m.35439 type:complete len:85 (+) Transcript_9979:1187-1441(+)
MQEREIASRAAPWNGMETLNANSTDLSLQEYFIDKPGDRRAHLRCSVGFIFFCLLPPPLLRWEANPGAFLKNFAAQNRSLPSDR